MDGKGFRAAKLLDRHERLLPIRVWRVVGKLKRSRERRMALHVYDHSGEPNEFVREIYARMPPSLPEATAQLPLAFFLAVIRKPNSIPYEKHPPDEFNFQLNGALLVDFFKA